MNHETNKCPKCNQWYLIEEHQDEVPSYTMCHPCRAKHAFKNLKGKINDKLIQDVFRKYTSDKTSSSDNSE